MSKTIYIIGAGIAGLGLAYYLINRKCGYRIEIFEASKHLGGRCRSFYDDDIAAKIDNGNHLCLKANEHVLDIIDNLNIADNFHTPCSDFMLVDASDNGKVTHINSIPSLVNSLNLKDKITFGLFMLFGYINKEKLERGKTVLYSNILNPMCRSVLNTSFAEADLSILRNVLSKVLTSKIRRGYEYFYPKTNWHDALLSPLTELLLQNGVKVNLNTSLSSIEELNSDINRLLFKDNSIDVGGNDIVIFATPYNITNQLLMLDEAPYSFQSIINIHYKYKPKNDSDSKITCFINSPYIEWLFIKENHVSVTISAANDIVNIKSDELAEKCWKEISKKLGYTARMPNYKVVKEKRATFECTKENLKLRPREFNTKYHNCFVTGDFVNNNIPSTIEGTLLNSKKLADILLEVK